MERKESENESHSERVMPKVDGRKIVAIATAGTLAAVAFGQIYLPFIADRDKVRGLSEEDEVPEGARKEMEELFKQSGGTFPPSTAAAAEASWFDAWKYVEQYEKRQVNKVLIRSGDP